jgi:hypothetical protein
LDQLQEACAYPLQRGRSLYLLDLGRAVHTAGIGGEGAGLHRDDRGSAEFALDLSLAAVEPARRDHRLALGHEAGGVRHERDPERGGQTGPQVDPDGRVPEKHETGVTTGEDLAHRGLVRLRCVAGKAAVGDRHHLRRRAQLGCERRRPVAAGHHGHAPAAQRRGECRPCPEDLEAHRRDDPVALLDDHVYVAHLRPLRPSRARAP